MACRDFIRDSMEEFGYLVEYQNFSYNDINGTNIIARSQPGDEYYGNNASIPEENNLQRKTFILGAHYDTRPYTGIYELEDQPIMGANDGASGVAVLLELARVFSVHPIDMDLEFVFFDLEDSGLFSYEYAQGSKFYAESLTEDEKEKIIGAIVVDMIGDRELDIYYEKNSDEKMMEDIWREAAKLNYNEFHHSEKFNMFDDHRRLISAGIPTVLLIDFDYPHWHTQNDTLDKVSGESLEKVGRVIERYLYSMTEYDRLKAWEKNLVIESQETVTLSDGVHQVNGNISVRGELIIEDAMLIVNGEENYEHKLEILDGGSLVLRNSILTAPHMTTIFENHGSLMITDSLVEQLWGNTQIPPYQGGIQMMSPDFRIVNSTIRYSATRGIFVRNIQDGHTHAIEGSSILDNGEVGLYIENSQVSVRRCLFKGNGRGAIQIIDGGIFIEDSEIGHCLPEGSCTTGSCSGPDPTFGIALSNTDSSSVIRNTSFHNMDNGIVGSYFNDTVASLLLQNNTMEGLDRGVELLHASAEVDGSTFNNSGTAIFFQTSNPLITGNLINNSRIGIRSVQSGGTIANNTIMNTQYNGLFLERSSLRVENNIISNASSGIYLNTDLGSQLSWNSIHNSNFGIYARIVQESEDTYLRGNHIWGNDWAIYSLGDYSRIQSNGTDYQQNGTTNLQGILWEERQLSLNFRNNTDDVLLNILAANETVYSEQVSVWAHATVSNLTIRKTFHDQPDWSNTVFTVRAISGDQTVEREIDILMTSELLMEFPVDQ